MINVLLCTLGSKAANWAQCTWKMISDIFGKAHADQDTFPVSKPDSICIQLSKAAMKFLSSISHFLNHKNCVLLFSSLPISFFIIFGEGGGVRWGILSDHSRLHEEGSDITNAPIGFSVTAHFSWGCPCGVRSFPQSLLGRPLRQCCF